MVINKNIWISAATKESKQLKNQGTCARASKEGWKQSGQTTDTIPKSWQQHIYIMRMEKMAFCLPHARIDQEENLSNKLLLILPCSKEGLLLHSCASHKVASLSQNVRKKEVGGIEAKNNTGRCLLWAAIPLELAWRSAGRPLHKQLPMDAVPAAPMWDSTLCILPPPDRGTAAASSQRRDLPSTDIQFIPPGNV